jgi:RimJ/RimL family protein N-acetyltransferase
MTNRHETERLRLIDATPEMISAELEGQERLAELLGAELPHDWPPEYHDAETLRFWGEELSRPGAAGWWLHYMLLRDSARPVLVGTVSYKGPPTDGVVEIGYSVVPSWQRRGLATEAAQALIDAAWERGAQAVVAHTFAHLEPSIGVLRKLAFECMGTTDDGELEFRLLRA